MVVDLALGTASGQGDDRLVGDAEPNKLNSDDGDNVIDGAGGDDVFVSSSEGGESPPPVYNDSYDGGGRVSTPFVSARVVV